MSAVKRVMVFRLGSIGDFVVALPGLHAVKRKYPDAQIALLTNAPVELRASAAQTVLDYTGLIDRFIYYTVPMPVREVRKQIRSFAPDMLVYLAEPRGALSAWRDYAFMRWCGIRKQVGAPFLAPPQQQMDLHESEAARLARCLKPHFGAIALGDPANWDLHITAAEQAEASALLGDLPRPLLGLSVGTKQAINDWGADNWRAVADGLSDLTCTLVLIGSQHERALSEELGQRSGLAYVNLCGRVSVRGSAAAMGRLALFVCHDSGPMHLAAAMGVPCIAVFSRLNPAGKWFPAGTHHQIFYPPSGQTIQATAPAGVVDAIHHKMKTFAAPDRARAST